MGTPVQCTIPIQGLSHCTIHSPSQSQLLILTHRHLSRLQLGKNMAFDCHLQYLSSPVGSTRTGVGRRRKGHLSPDLRYIHASTIHQHQGIPSDSMASSLVEMRRLSQMSFIKLVWRPTLVVEIPSIQLPLTMLIGR
jgi:hypothetical protein